MIEKLIDDGIDGIVILGSVGEFFNFSSLEEKKDYIKFVSEVIELNKYANDVLIITPYFFGLDENYIYEYYSTIAKNIELPIMIYNFPCSFKREFSSRRFSNQICSSIRKYDVSCGSCKSI